MVLRGKRIWHGDCQSDVGNTHSCIFSPDDTFVLDGTLVKVLGWYDNEWGFSSRTVEMMARML